MRDPVSFAADIGKAVASAKCSLAKGSNPGLVRRAKEFPSLMLSVGFGPAFTFFLAKVEDYNAVSEVFRYLSGGGANSQALCSEMEAREGAGYAGYVAILLLALREVGKSISVDGGSLELYINLLDVAKQVSVKEARRLAPYLEEVKEVLEALPYG